MYKLFFIIYISNVYQYINSILDFSKALEISQYENDKYFNYRGICYIKLRKFQEAFNDFKKSISINKNNYQTYNYLAYSYLIQKNYYKVIEYSNIAILLNSQNYVSYCHRFL